MHYDQFCSGFPVPRETYDRLALYHKLLIKWQATINLISPQTIPDIWERHILDCCQFYPLIVSRETTASGSIVDLGSGAGLPGIILAILGASPVHLVESDQRKCVFLQEATRLLELNCIIHSQRIETLSLPSPDYVTARGCAPLPRLLSWAYPLLSASSICLFAKGRHYATELAEAETQWHYTTTIHPSRTEPGAALLEMRDISPRQ